MLRVIPSPWAGVDPKIQRVTRDPRGDQEIEHEVPDPHQVRVLPKGKGPYVLKSATSVGIDA